MTSIFKRVLGSIHYKAYRLKQSILRKAGLLPPPPPPLRVAVVGCGTIASTHVDSYRRAGGAQVVAMCDIYLPALAKAGNRWRSVRTYRDYRQMLREIKPDIVSVCTWPQSHPEIVMETAAAGVKAILCEKPLALQMCEIEKMITSCEQAGVKLAGGHHYRFHPHFVRAAEIVQSGVLGEIKTVKGHVVGTLADNGPHLMDSVRFILGDPIVKQVTCSCRRIQNRFYQDIPSEDGSSGEILFDGGVRFEFQTGEFAPGFFTISVEGTSGSVEATPETLKVSGSAEAANREPLGPECRERQFSEFVQWVKGQRPGYAAGYEPSARAAELVLALYASARLGHPVDLPLQEKGDIIGHLYPGPAPERPREAALPPQPGTAVSEPLAMDGGPRAVTEWFSFDACVGDEELEGLTRVIRSKHMNCTGGRETPALEEEFARAYGSPHAVASTSGTAAIHVALGALNLNPCDEVITTPITDMGTIVPILACNCIPVFADVDPLTGNMTAESIAKKITPRTRAVILVHLFGRPADLSPISDLLKEKNISLIEDCCQAHFAEYRGQKVGTFGDFGCLSLQQSKQITCGDGGITLINREDLAERAALFADKGWDREHGTRTHLFMGMNYRMTELQAAVARAQLAKLPDLIKARRESAGRLSDLLSQTEGIVLPPDPQGAVCSWWYYNFALDKGLLCVSEDEFCDVLRVEGVQVMQRYLPGPVFDYPVLKEQRTYGDSRYPFSGVSYEPPDIHHYPGFLEFQRRQMYIMWTNHVRPQHAEAIAQAVRKVAGYYQALNAKVEPVGSAHSV